LLQKERSTLLKNIPMYVALFAACLLAGRSTAQAANSERLAQGEHTARLNGLSFHYTVAGHGPLLVVQAPGWGIGSNYLRNGLKPLEEQFTLLTFDPRGSNASSHVKSTDHLTNADLADDLEHLRQYWGVETLNLIGHSNGSAIAIVYAERYPERVNKLVLIGSQLLGYKSSANAVSTAEDARRKSEPQFSYYLAHINDPTPHTDAEFTRYFRERAGYFFYNPSRDLPTFLGQLTNTMTASVNQAYLESPAPDQAPPLSDLKKIRAQTLIVAGRQDPACPLAESEAIQSGIAGAKLVAIDRTGHFPWLESPKEFYPPVVQFLKK
jgi:proline iminopeptidase